MKKKSRTQVRSQRPRTKATISKLHRRGGRAKSAGHSAQKNAKRKNSHRKLRAQAKNFNRTLAQQLPKRQLTSLARQTRFQKRAAKTLSAWLFVQSACLLVTQKEVSFRNWALLIGLLCGRTFAPQSLHERVGPEAVSFLQAVLESLLETLVGLRRTELLPYLSPFQRALLDDSTVVGLGQKLAPIFPGARNQRGACGGSLKIQAAYDLVHQRFVHFSLSSYRRNDQAAAADALEWIQPGDLLVRDLGYFVIWVLQAIGNRGAFFLSRLRMGSLLYELDGQTPVPLLQRLRQQGRLDEELLLGAQKVPVRVVAVPVSAAEAAARRAKARAKAKRDGRTNLRAEPLALLNWEIFVTNVPRRLWSARVVAQIYGLRWRVETIFKAWKSHFALAAIPEEASAAEAQCLLYAKLLFIVLFHLCFWRPVRRAHAQWGRAAPSLLKLSQALVSLFLALFLEELGISVAAAWAKQAAYHCRYEKRRRRTHFLEQMVPLSAR